MAEVERDSTVGERPAEVPKRTPLRFFFFSIPWLRDLAIAVVLALAIIVFVYQPVRVEGTSMAPRLGDQDRIFINKLIYKFEPIERGDIVVFRYPRDTSKSFIKRVVGLPGETVEIRDGVVTINGLRLKEDYLPGGNGDLASYPPTTLPAENYFLLGDNRASSNDSRAWGAVHRDYIYGKAVFAHWPPERFGLIEDKKGTE